MNVINTPVAAVAIRTLDHELDDREREEPDTGGDGERSSDGEHDQEQPDRHGERQRSKHRGTAREREDAAAAPEPGEDREGVADHRSPRADVRHTPHTGVGECEADERCQHTLERIADEDRDRCPLAERLPSVPVSRVAVANRSQVDLGPSGGDEVGDRDRADEIADHHRDGDVDGGLGAHW